MINQKKAHMARPVAAVLTVLAATGLAVFGSEAGSSAKDGIILCGKVVIPALFPFFVVSSFAIELGAAEYAGFLMERFMRLLFNVGGACAPAFVLGLFGGYPVGAKTAVSLYSRGICSKTEGERLLAFCNNSGPAFILGAVGTGILKDVRAGAILYAAHILAAITTGIIFRWYKHGEISSESSTKNLFIKARHVTGAFINSVTSGLGSILNVCAFVVLFSVIIRLLYLFKIIPAAANLLFPLLRQINISSADTEHFISGLVEVTSGLWAMSSSIADMPVKLALAAFMLGWSGLSVHFQVVSFVIETDLSLKPYFLGKIISAFSASVYAFAFAVFFHIPVSAGNGFTDYSAISSFLNFPNILLFAFLLCVFLWFVILLSANILRRTKNKSQTICKLCHVCKKN